MFGLSLTLVACVLVARYASAQSVSSDCILDDMQLAVVVDNVISRERAITYDDPGTCRCSLYIHELLT